MNNFIGIKLGDLWLDLPEDLSIQIEMWNALFETDRIPGTLTYPITLPDSPVNKKALGFPGHLSVTRYTQPQLSCHMYLLGQLWRVGRLNVIKRTPKGYEVNFQTDVGDVSSQLKEVSLRDLDLGTDELRLQVSGIYPEENYALFPVRNTEFYGDAVEYFAGTVNFYNDGFPASWNSPITPFPYLLYVLEKVMAHFGYTVTGSWAQEEETRRLVIYNTYALMPATLANGAPITFTDHVPDMKVNEFLKAIRTLFCLGMVFNPLRKELEIIRLSDVVNDRSYVDWTENTGRLYDWEPATAGGFLLEMQPDSDDELQKTAPGLTLAIGNAQTPVSTPASTLGMTVFTSRLMPHASQKGANLDGSGEPGKFSLRLLSYRGLQMDQTQNPYPLGTSGAVDANGQVIASQSLEWAGPQGLYETCHRPWLTFLDEAEMVETEQVFRIQDIISLDFRKRSFIRHASGTFAALWPKITITVSQKKGIHAAKVPLKRIY